MLQKFASMRAYGSILRVLCSQELNLLAVTVGLHVEDEENTPHRDVVSAEYALDDLTLLTCDDAT